MDHGLSKASVIEKKLLSDEKQIFGTLIGQSHSRSHAGVYKKVIAIRMTVATSSKIVVVSGQAFASKAASCFDIGVGLSGGKSAGH